MDDCASGLAARLLRYCRPANHPIPVTPCQPAASEQTSSSLSYGRLSLHTFSFVIPGDSVATHSRFLGASGVNLVVFPLPR